MTNSVIEQCTIHEQLRSIKEQLEDFQDDIVRTQSIINDLSSSGDCIESMLFRFSSLLGINPDSDAQYLLKNLLEFALERGVESERYKADLNAVMNAENND